MSPRGLRLSVRMRLTALYAALFGLSGALLLGISYWLVARHFHRTLTDSVADATLADLRGQYAVALVGTLLVAVALYRGTLGHPELVGDTALAMAGYVLVTSSCFNLDTGLAAFRAAGAPHRGRRRLPHPRGGLLAGREIRASRAAFPAAQALRQPLHRGFAGAVVFVLT